MDLHQLVESLLNVLAYSDSALPPPRPREEGLFDVEVEAGGGRLVKRVDRYPTLPSFIAIDGSSRRVSTPGFSIHVAGVAAHGVRPGLPLTYPGKWDLGESFIAVRAPRSALKRLEGLPYVMVSHGGRYFDESFVVEDDISDLLRGALENAALRRALEEAGGDYVIVDGPIYITHKSVEDVAIKRLEIVADSRGVVGVVKRVEKSGKLCRDAVLRALGLSLSPEHCNDAYITQRLSSGSHTIVGPFLMKMPNARPVEFWYVNALGSIYRVEALQGAVDDEIVEALALSTTNRGVPYPIDLVDRYAKSITAAFVANLRDKIKSRGLALTYESEEAIRRALMEINAWGHVA